MLVSACKIRRNTLQDMDLDHSEKIEIGGTGEIKHIVSCEAVRFQPDCPFLATRDPSL